MTSPLNTMARLTSPISPTITGPKQASANPGAAPNSRSNWLEALVQFLAHGHEAAQRAAIDRTAAFRPGHDYLIADIIEDLAAIVHDGKGKQAKSAIEEAMDADAAKPLGQPGRARDIDEQHEAVFLHRGVIAAGDEIQEGSLPDDVGDRDNEIRQNPNQRNR